jgi:hypothetical protein
MKVGFSSYNTLRNEHVPNWPIDENTYFKEPLDKWSTLNAFNLPINIASCRISGKGLIQEDECINVGAGSAWPLITGFPNFFTNNRLGRGHHNTKQVRKPKVSKKLLAFTRLRPQISNPISLDFAPDVNRADCGSPHKESKWSCSKNHWAHFRRGSRSNFLGTNLDSCEANWILESECTWVPSLILGSPNQKLSFNRCLLVWTNWFSLQNSCHISLNLLLFGLGLLSTGLGTNSKLSTNKIACAWIHWSLDLHL